MARAATGSTAPGFHVAAPVAAPPIPETPAPVLSWSRSDGRPVVRFATIRQPIEFFVWIAYVAVVALGIACHEPWADEAQAWLLARDQGFWRLMLHAIRYEGSPGLWHALLWLLARLHISYIGMHWVSGVIAVAGIYVFLRWSPFPLALRILFPFGFWLAYQDAVVARSYVLFAVLAFAAAAILRTLSERDTRWPVRRATLPGLAVVLGLMANLSIHGFIASIGFAIVAWVVVRRRFRAGVRTTQAVPALILCAFWAFVIATTFPPTDVDFAAGKNLERSVQKIDARFGNQQAKAALLAGSSSRGDVRPGELAPLPPLVFHRTARQTLWHKVGRLLSLLTYPVSNFKWLALVVCVLIVAQAIVFRAGPAQPDQPGQLGWIGLLPWALMVLLFTSMYMAPRHAGMLWESLVAALWLTWPANAAPADFPKTGSAQPRRPAALWLRRVTLAALILAALDQVWWTAHSLWADIHQPYSGDVAMARFLHAQPPGKRIAGFYYHTVGPEAFFSSPIYFNQPTTYWVWSRNQRIVQQAPATIATHPDIIVVGGWEWNGKNGNIVDDWIPSDPDTLNRVPLNDAYGIIPYAEARGYRETHRFCGRAFIRDGYSELLCQVALEPAPQPAAGE